MRKFTYFDRHHYRVLEVEITLVIFKFIKNKSGRYGKNIHHRR